jgi:hypothetical protein
VPERFKADEHEKLRKDMIKFIDNHQIPIPPYYMRFISQELTPENIKKVQNELSAAEV